MVIPGRAATSTHLRSSSSNRVDGKPVAFLLFRTDHSRNYLCKADLWSPAELPCRLRGVASRIADVSGASERIIAFNVVLPSQSNFGKRGRHKFIQPVGYTRSNNKILGPIMLKHHPHRFYIVRRPTPVMACTRFRRHRVRCFDGTGGGSWRDGSLPASSSLRLCG